MDRTELSPKDRIIVALDVDTLEQALVLVQELKDHVGMFKIGLELIFTILVAIITPKSFREAARNLVQVRDLFQALSGKIMLDGKFKDIPNTMRGAARAAAKLGVKMFTVHASASEEGVGAAVDAAKDTKVIAVTVLTSMDEDVCESIYGHKTAETVLRFAYLAKAAGATCLVCSAKDLEHLRGIEALSTLLKITPGIRLANTSAGDQKRVMTPGLAIKAGADMLVIGRSITEAQKELGITPAEAADRAAAEIAEALAA